MNYVDAKMIDALEAIEKKQDEKLDELKAITDKQDKSILKINECLKINLELYDSLEKKINRLKMFYLPILAIGFFIGAFLTFYFGK